MSRSYEILNALPPESFLQWEDFRTAYDSLDVHLKETRAKQYQEGLKIGKEAKEIYISCNSTWGATLKNGGILSSYEGIGYHACTADLLKGFLDSGCPIVVYRYSIKGETRIK